MYSSLLVDLRTVQHQPLSPPCLRARYVVGVGVSGGVGGVVGVGGGGGGGVPRERWLEVLISTNV